VVIECHVVLEPRGSAGKGLRSAKGNNVQGVSMGVSSEPNGPCSDERGSTEVPGLHFTDEIMYMYLTYFDSTA
jgi:hypothetical protein